MQNCIFCQIVAGKSPAYKIYEDEHHLAFLDIYPFGWGHTQLIPKKHYRRIWDIKDLGAFMHTAKKLVHQFNRQPGVTSVFALVIGEWIPHAHLQLLPRTDANHQIIGQAVSSIRQPQLDPKEAQAMQQLLQVKYTRRTQA